MGRESKESAPGKTDQLYKGKRGWFLTSQYLVGIFSLPNYFQTPWKNTVYRLVVSRIIFIGFCIFIIPAVSASMFIYAIHDLSEFLQRFLESILAISYLGEMIHCNFRLKRLLNIFAVQDRIFCVSNKKIHARYAWKEDLEMKINVVFNLLSFCGVLFETMLPTSERTRFLMTDIYHRKYPGRVLPFMAWTSSLDTSEARYFFPLYFTEIYLLLVIVNAIFGVIALQIIVPTPLVGQYRMLGEFVERIGREHRDEGGQSIFYTDVATGQYLTEREQVKYWKSNIFTRRKNQASTYAERQEEAMIKFAEWRQKIYPNWYLNQIIKRHQQLNNFMTEYMKFMGLISSTTIIPFMTVIVLSFYQMANMKNLPWVYCLKILVEFAFVICGACHVSTQSELINHCNEIVAQAIYQSHWYKGSPAMKRSVCIMLRNSQESRHFTLLWGLIKITYKDFLMKIFQSSLTFLNFMKFKGLL